MIILVGSVVLFIAFVSVFVFFALGRWENPNDVSREMKPVNEVFIFFLRIFLFFFLFFSFLSFLFFLFFLLLTINTIGLSSSFSIT